MPALPRLKLNLRLPESLRDRCVALAERDQVSINTVILKALDNYLTYREGQLQSHPRRRVPAATSEPLVPSVGRNQPCPCGSGQKFKFCHGA